MKNKIIITVLLTLSFTICKAQTYLEQGIHYYQLRAEKHQELKVDSININKAIDFFIKEIGSANDEKASEYLLLSYYYKAAFIVRTKQDQQHNYQLGALLGEKAIIKYPKNEAILLWYIANFSKYGESLGVVSSAKNGLADKVKLHTEKLIALNPKFNDGAGYKILGVINYKVPHIPLIITWPSKQVAEDYLKKALAVNPKSISNLFYYAEYLSEVKRKEEAKIILKMVVESTPRKSNLIEALYDITQAKKLLNKLSDK